MYKLLLDWHEQICSKRQQNFTNNELTQTIIRREIKKVYAENHDHTTKWKINENSFTKVVYIFSFYLESYSNYEIRHLNADGSLKFHYQVLM